LDADTAAVAAHAEEGGDGTGAVARPLSGESSRRRFLRALGTAAGTSALATVSAACGTQRPIGFSQGKPGTVGNFGPGDGGIVNYALFLEYIEGDFYDRAVRSGDIRDRRQLDVFKQARENEAEHRNLLVRMADQVGRPLSKPKTNFEAIFGAGPRRIVAFAGELDNLVAAAYLGQLARVIDTAILTSLVSIHTVEARQGAAFSDLAGRGFQAGGALRGSLPTGAFARPMTMTQVLPRVRPYYVGEIPTLRPPAD
jgi:hypothetical protein